MPSTLKIAVVGTGISGLSAAWLLSSRHEVTVFEAADRVGGHSNTVSVESDGQEVPIDTGFIVFNHVTYPNLSALFRHLEVKTELSEMSFSVSLNQGRLEYSSEVFWGQLHNFVQPRFWQMLYDLRRFHQQAQSDIALLAAEPLSIGDYLRLRGFSDAFRDNCLLPMASAIWSCAPGEMLAYPAIAFVRFQANHQLLRFGKAPPWETVCGGSREYVRRLMKPLAGRIRLNTGVEAIARQNGVVTIKDSAGQSETFDHVVVASHADQALAMLADADADEQRLLGAFRYSRNHTVLHSDESLMPTRRQLWSSWNYMGEENGRLCVTYWMNRLQNIKGNRQYFVTLNPIRPPRAGTLIHGQIYEHPLFDANTHAAQSKLWHLQGKRNTWFCGAHFGAGFHEDGLQAGLAVAEQLGGVRRPWQVANESSRIVIASKDVLEPA
ncbi:NAD(P)/FAD-dependent oxidoreductase [Rhizomicrobium electricum]|uniref:NAD(P)/FAD-dependent oxidoreductase n=1 Tax=Rhizomicrobium electricum TaxID=480070 RepID=A0ABN1F7N2_9PROT|nr:FAD-dependent oxidoreductase [Rhizomicrobium electricum]NIJ46704.1 hypothetical protein [Rhizomicrobium electricum]